MAVINVEVVESNVYKLTITTISSDTIDIISVIDKGIYNISFIKENTRITKTGRIKNIIQDAVIPQNGYLIFDVSQDTTNVRERIFFYQIIYITDVTPDNAYTLAVEHGFTGTEEEWLTSLEGKSAYEVAVANGFEGTESEWLTLLKYPGRLYYNENAKQLDLKDVDGNPLNDPIILSGLGCSIEYDSTAETIVLRDINGTTLTSIQLDITTKINNALEAL